MIAAKIKNASLTRFYGLNGSERCVYAKIDALINGEWQSVFLEIDSKYYQNRYFALKSSNDTVPLSKRLLKLIEKRLCKKTFDIYINPMRYRFITGAIVFDNNKIYLK